MINKNQTWKTDVKLVDIKNSKSIGIHFFKSTFLWSIDFELTHPYISYANITWVSTKEAYVKQILRKKGG